MSHSMPSPYPTAGEVIDGKYQIERILGEGGMGCVAKAIHLVLRAPVALKFMNPQFMTFPGAVERFINEGIASKKIRSDHVVPVDDVGKLSTGAPYLVMPCLEGVDLADLLARDGTPGLPTSRAIHFTVQILRGLQAAHAAGIIHRDMKPSNCFVVKHDGEGDFVRILDFGISKVVQPGQSASLTQTNSALGTPLYMSPEQARSPRDVDGRSDIYSVGVILYELLTGHTPFFSESGEFTEILFKLFTADPPPVKSTRPDLDDGLAAVVHKALARDVNDRYATAQEMAAALEPYAGDESRHVLARIKTFKAAEALSMPPPADMPLPTSLVAFSALDARPQTDVMANRPTTDVMKSPPVTQLLADAPGRVAASPVIRSGSEPPARMSAAPSNVDARVRSEDASARTQLDAGRGAGDPVRVVTAGVQTDLGASRDAPAAPEPTRSRSPLLFALPVVALLVGIGGVVALRGAMSGGPKTPGSAATATSEVVPTAATPTAALTTATATASTAAATASAPASATASASASASASPKSTTKPPPPQGHPSTPTAHPTNVLDTTMKQ